MPDKNVTNETAVTPVTPTTPTLRVHIVCGTIEDVGQEELAADCPGIDAIAVGHYAKVEPQFAELALDNAISGFLPSLKANATDSVAVGVITDLTTRGIIQGELAVPFFLPDPRDNGRIIVIAGMGSVGRFGAPELGVLVEQMFWALARLGRKHLATVLIGSGTGNIETDTAVAHWMDGAAVAIANGPLACPTDLTFVEKIPAKAEEIRSALLNHKSGPNRPGLTMSVTPLEPIPVPNGEAAPRPAATKSSTHISGEKRGKRYMLGALSDEASYHETHTDFDPDTIVRANNELAAKATAEHQRQAGEFLFKLIAPKSLRDAFARKDPIVIECDNHVAQLHWEMMVVRGLARNSIGDGSEFLGIYPGIARQFRNSFVLPPAPPRMSGRTLQVLIVADTDDVRPLQRSQDEAKTIAELFKEYDNFLQSSGASRRISVETLIGPDRATYDNVLERLLKYPPYDILHYSGHCEYVEDDPPKSGWLFSKGKKITAYELAGSDCVPGFIFSNACCSGDIPDHKQRGPMPSFAEEFFKQGVRNFVCTAWPVAGGPAHDFACTFYREMLGSANRRGSYMFEAMREARKSILNTNEACSRSWGAYQHYGNPWYRLV